MENNKIIKASISVLGGFLTHLILGTLYLWANISLYATSYFRYNGYPELQNSTMEAVFAISIVGLSIGSFFGVPIARRFGHKITSSIAMIVYVASVFAASESNFEWFVITMGFIPGLCIGIEFLIPVDNAVSYYPEKKGLIIGLILGGFGFSIFVFNPVIQYFINPNNVCPNQDGYYPQDVAENLPHALFKISWIYLGIGLGGSLMMFETKNQFKNIVVLKNKNQISDVEKSEQNLIEKQNKLKSIWDLFKDKQIYWLWGFGLMITSQFKTYGAIKIQNDDNFFSLVGSLGGFSNGISRFFWSALLDYISPNKLMLINMLMMTLIAGTFNLVSTSKVSFMIWMILIFFQYGGIYAYFPTACTKTFGEYYGPYAFNIIYTAIITSNFTQFFLTKYLVPQIQYVGIFYIYCGSGVMGMIIQVIYIRYSKSESLVSISKLPKEELLEILSQY